MRHIKEIATAVGTLALAVSIGFVMQSSETARNIYGTQARTATIPSAVAEGNILSGNPHADVLSQVEDIELTSGNDPEKISNLRSDGSVQRVSILAIEELPADPSNALGCEITSAASAIPGAMVFLTLTAPCAANERLTVHHNGMMFTESTESTDAAGRLELTVPALTKQAVFILAFSNGDGAVLQADVPDIALFDRVVLQWRGAAGFELHAREFGADYGQAGHVWSGGDQIATGLTDGARGLVLRMGDAQSAEPLVAEVYTFATGRTARSGTIDLSVEAEVTADNCGLEIEAQSLELMQAGQLKTQSLTLAVPACDAVGSFLVLNNLVSDLKVAHN